MNRLIFPLALGLLTGGVLASSCGPTRTCNATTCTGCCDTTGECRSGFDNSACGTRASACATCGLGQTCLSGACSTTGAGAGTGTGGGFSGTGGGSAAGGSAGGVVSCNSTNCPGCCATNGQCFTGRSDSVCGTNGASCAVCQGGQTCTPLAVGGRCLSSGPGGGSAGGGSATGGGGAGGGAPGCSAQNCANGCCNNGQCQNPTTARCGRNGASCTACASMNTCVNGACALCAGCIDLNTGDCVTSTTNTLCGRQGQFCSDCTLQSRTCQSGACLPPPPPCTAQNCSTGCCDSMSGACIPRASQTATQCGQGSAGAECIACSSGSCDTSTGACSTGGFDGGLPFPDGGLGSFCFPGLPVSSCGPGDCCFPFMGLGICATIGNPNLLGGTTCGVSGMDCNPTPCTTNQSCSVLGVCQ